MKERDPRGTKRWQKLRANLYERDRRADARCWICGQPIDYRAPSGTPDSWEPDHVLPVSARPDLAFDVGNIKPSHCSCNRARGKRGNANDLGSPSRAW